MNDCRRLYRSLRVRGAVLFGALALLLAYAPAVQAQRVLNETVISGEASQPIKLGADYISTSTESNYHVVTLRGNVIVSQGSVTLRSPEVIVWVDQSRHETERLYQVTVYAEGSVELERNNAVVQADFGYVRLATTGDIPMNAFKGKIEPNENLSGDPTYLRGLARRPENVALPTAKALVKEGIQLVGGTQPAIPLPPPPPPIAEPKPGVSAVPEAKKTLYFQVPPQPPMPAGGGPLDSPIPPPAPPPTFSPIPLPASPATPAQRPPQLSIRSRYAGDLQVQYKPLPDGSTAVIVSGGVTIVGTTAATRPGEKVSSFDIEADRVVIWTRGNGPQILGNTREAQNIENGAHEIYMSGNVELRTRSKTEVETLRADEVYYDVRRGVAVARKAELELKTAKLPRSVYLVTDEFLQINPKLYKLRTSSTSASILPSDPGLKVDTDDMTIEEFEKERSYLPWNLLPAYDKDGKRIVETQRIFTARNMVTRLEGVPIFYFPYLKGRVEDPLGPLEGFNVSYNKIFGLQVYSTWDVFDLLNLPRPDGTRWRLMLDLFTERGPGFGTEYDFEGRDLLGIRSQYSGLVRLYGNVDNGEDVLGGDRGNFAYWPDSKTTWPINHPNFRGWAFGKVNVQDLPDGFSVRGQFSFLSDRNYLEQYYLNTHLNEMDQKTFLNVKQQANIWAWTLEGQIGTRSWMTETDWLPKADGYLLGQTFFDDWLVYNAHASAGFGRLRPTDHVPFAYLPTDVRTDTVRLDLMQDISVPFYLGPVKVSPYGVLDTAYYSQDTAGDGRGRLYGGGGIRWNMPLSRLYPDIQSDLFNVDGIYHKINLTGNYYTAHSSSGVNNFPQLDRLNDDASDQALRNIRPWQSVFNKNNANYLTTSNLFNPQNYAIRRLLDSNVDTLDSIDVLQLGINQRWQTKRGMPGNEHAIDWMTLNLGISIFPHSQRDNFGHTFGIAEYDWVWNIGDRTALTSSGWFEPVENGPRAFNVGAVLHRPDSTAFYLGYRQIDPVNSKAVVASLIYPFSAKYAISANTVWDFGVDVQTYSFFLSRMGTDVMVNFGLTYNSTLSTFGIAFEILPNLARSTSRASNLFPAAAGTIIDPMAN